MWYIHRPGRLLRLLQCAKASDPMCLGLHPTHSDRPWKPQPSQECPQSILHRLMIRNCFHIVEGQNPPGHLQTQDRQNAPLPDCSEDSMLKAIPAMQDFSYWRACLLHLLLRVCGGLGVGQWEHTSLEVMQDSLHQQ